MTIPWPEGRPETSVGTDSSAQLSQGIQVLVSKFNSLERVIATQTAMMERTLSAANRYQSAGQGQMRQDILGQVISAGGSAHGARTSQVTPLGAVSSLENLRAFGAQRLGQWIAGTPLFEQPQQQQQGAGMTPPGTPTASQVASAANPPPAGGTPAGMPTSAGRPAGAGTGGGGGGGGGGARPAAPGHPGGGGGGQGRGGLPGMVFGQGRHANVPTTTTAVLRQMGARVAMGGGTMSSVTNALRSIPGVGLAMDMIGGGTNWYLNQREAGRTYQGVEGGSNWNAQFERLHGLEYQIGMFGRMPGGAAAQAFGAVTGMGYNQANSPGLQAQQQNRGSALDFVYNNYSRTGMDVNESIQMLQVASQNANVELDQLSTTLNSLSNVAGQAGDNADTARQQFLSYFQTALNLGTGNGSQTIAGGIAAMQASYGKEFTGTNFSGDLTQGRQYLLAGMAGMSPPQLQYIGRNNPGGYLKLLAGQNMQFLTEGGMMTPQMMSSLQQMISRAGGGNSLMTNPALADQISQQFLNQWQLKGNINQALWAQEISGLTGNNLTANNVMQWIVQQAAGVNEASHNTAVGGPNGASVSANKIPSGTPTGQYGLAVPKTPYNPHGRRGEKTMTWQSVLTSGPNGEAAAPYLAAEAKSGQRSPVLEALLQNASPSDMVAVQTRKGQRVMSLAQAMQYYPNELASGNVEFYNSSGQAVGNTGAITRGLANPNASVSAEEKQAAGSNAGQALAAFEKAHAASQTVPQGNGNSVTVTLSQEAQQLLKLLPANNDQAAATSSVPANPYVAQASR